jgi:DNA adenine methylase
MSQVSSQNPTPLVKWVGGKRQLQTPILAKILEVFEPQRGTYFEPFFGGGAIFFALKPVRGVASDLNSGLVNLYRQVSENPELVLSSVEKLQVEYNSIGISSKEKYFQDKRHYFNARDSSGLFINREGVDGAALFLFLNKAGFNGMYRENRLGEFNIPFGKREFVNLVDEANIFLVSDALKNLEIFCQSYESTIVEALPGDFVYFDPPYAPLSKTSSFEGYNRDNLDGFDQKSLRDFVVGLTNKGVHCLVSNSSAESIEGLYSDFNMAPLAATRAISASVSGRKSVKEYLIDNFEQVRE